MNVELVRWPGDPQRLAGLRDRGVPRLLLVSDEAEPPIPTDCLEDWVAAGAPESALEARRRALARTRRVRTARVPRSTTTGCSGTTTRGCRSRPSSNR